MKPAVKKMDKTGMTPRKQAVNKLMRSTALTDEARIKHFKNIAEECLREFMFEPNDKSTRRAIQSVTNHVFTDLLRKGYLHDVAVVCDETINTPDTVDDNKALMDVAIKLEEGDEFQLIKVEVGPT